MGFVTELSQELNARALLQRMKEWDVDTSELAESIESLSKTHPKRADLLRRMAKAKGLMNERGEILQKKVNAYFEDLSKLERRNEIRLGKFGNLNDKTVDWIGNLSAAALAYSGVSQAYDLFTREANMALNANGALAGTTGRLWHAVSGTRWAKAAGAAKAYDHDVEQLYNATTEMFYRTGVEVTTQQMVHSEALARTFGDKTNEVWGYIVERQKAYGESVDVSLRQLDRTIEGMAAIEKEAVRLGKPQALRVWPMDYYRIVHEVTEGTSRGPKNFSVVATVIGTALKRMTSKGVDSKGDQEAISKVFAGLLEEDPAISYRLGQDFEKRVMSEAERIMGAPGADVDQQKAELMAIERLLPQTLAAQAKNIHGMLRDRPDHPKFLEALGSLYRQVPQGASDAMKHVKFMATANGVGMGNAVSFFRDKGLTDRQAVLAAQMIVKDDGALEEMSQELGRLNKEGVAPTTVKETETVDSAGRGLLGAAEGLWEAAKASPIAKIVASLGVLGGTMWWRHRQMALMTTALATATTNVEAASLTQGGGGAAGTALSTVTGALESGSPLESIEGESVPMRALTTPAGLEMAATRSIGTQLASETPKLGAFRRAMGFVSRHRRGGLALLGVGLGTAAVLGAWKYAQHKPEPPEAPPPPPPPPPPPAAPKAQETQAKFPPPLKVDPPKPPPPPQKPTDPVKPPDPIRPKGAVAEAASVNPNIVGKKEGEKLKGDVEKETAKAKDYGEKRAKEEKPKMIDEAGEIAVKFIDEKTRLEYETPFGKGYQIKRQLQMVLSNPNHEKLTPDEEAAVRDLTAKARKRYDEGKALPEKIVIRVGKGAGAVQQAQGMSQGK